MEKMGEQAFAVFQADPSQMSTNGGKNFRGASIKFIISLKADTSAPRLASAVLRKNFDGYWGNDKVHEETQAEKHRDNPIGNVPLWLDPTTQRPTILPRIKFPGVLHTGV